MPYKLTTDYAGLKAGEVIGIKKHVNHFWTVDFVQNLLRSGTGKQNKNEAWKIIKQLKMEKIILIVIAAFTIVSCSQEPPKTYKHVVSIKSEPHTYPVTVTHHSGGNSVSRGAGGAVLGGGVDLLLGGSGKGGAVVGGLIGAATTDDPKSESYTEMRTEITYTITFNDSTIDIRKNYCHYTVGDSIRVY
jgi:hypothetical protein